jgi:hypothetical protein
LAHPELDPVRLDGDQRFDLELAAVVQHQDALLGARVFHHDAHQSFQQAAELKLSREGLGGAHGADQVQPARRVRGARR